MERFGASMRKARAVIKLSRVVYLYKSNARANSALVMEMKEITQTRVHYGYRQIHVMLRREGFRDNHKRI
jgi:putative transposase